MMLVYEQNAGEVTCTLENDRLYCFIDTSLRMGREMDLEFPLNTKPFCFGR